MHLVVSQEPWEDRSVIVPNDLKLFDFNLFGIYSLWTLVDFGILTLPAAVRISEQKLAPQHDALLEYLIQSIDDTGRIGRSPEQIVTFVAGQSQPLGYNLGSILVNPKLLEKLSEVNVQVPGENKAFFGENFSRLSKYNAGLDTTIMIGTDRASTVAKKSLMRHFNLSVPVPHDGIPSNPGSIEELVNRAREYTNPQQIEYDIKDYVHHQILTRRKPEEVIPGLKSLLLKISDNLRGDSQGEQAYARTLSNNAEALLRTYFFITDFKLRFEEQVKLLKRGPFHYNWEIYTPNSPRASVGQSALDRQYVREGAEKLSLRKSGA